jgi:ATP-dependent DNA helicase RecG
MAPTEVLAQQHYQTISQILGNKVEIGLLTSNTKRSERSIMLEKLQSNELKLLIGTHALIQDDVKFDNLRLIVIDEQHKFGVEQRSALRSKGNNPHLLIMTATPIPRTLSMTLFGDMQISYLKDKPLGRQPITTISLPEKAIAGIYNSINKYIDEGRQIYYVLPVIEESEKLDLKSAKEVFEHLANTVFVNRIVKMLHGKMKASEKEEIMSEFSQGKVNILVATTVIEVGINVPNATVMIIHHPERFGLSQLHQLRGRVGRGEHKSFCILLHSEDISENSKKRIDIMTKTDDGFLIAEEDLKLRGSGEIIGVKQHGLNEFEFTDLADDINIIESARNEALEQFDSIDDLSAPELHSMEERFGNIPLFKHIRLKRVLGILS